MQRNGRVDSLVNNTSARRHWAKIDMRVMVFERARGGHALNYHRVLLPALASLADELVVVVGDDALESEYAQVHLRSLPSMVHWDACLPKSRGSHLQQSLSARRALRDAIARHRPDHLYVPTADSLSQALGLAKAAGRRDFPHGLEAEAVLHRCGFAYPASTPKKRWFYKVGFWTHARAPWTRVFNVDVIAYEWIQAHGGDLARRNFLLPDPIDPSPGFEREAARRSLNLPEDGMLIGTAGGINRRKGVERLLAAFREANFPSSIRLLLAGQHESFIRELLASDYSAELRDGRITSLDRYLEVEELQQALGAMDLVCTPYVGQIAIASIVLRAAAAGRPVLAAGDGWCGRMVPKFNLGWTCNPYNVREFSAKLHQSLDAAVTWHRSEACERLLRFHAPENFVATLTARLRERLGQQAGASASRWSEVG